MKNKYKSVGLDYDLILEKFPNIQEYEMTVNTFLDDSFFKDIGDYLKDEDYALAKDATKGLYILAQELCLYPLYMALLDLYEDMEEEIYKDVYSHYEDMLKVHEKIRGCFAC